MLINETKRKKIAIRVVHAKNVFEKIRGIMFLNENSFNYALVMHMNRKASILNSIHSFFVFFPFLALFLDEKKVIVDKALVKPFSFYVPRKPCKYIVELPKNFYDEFEIKDKLSWK